MYFNLRIVNEIHCQHIIRSLCFALVIWCYTTIASAEPIAAITPITTMTPIDTPITTNVTPVTIRTSPPPKIEIDKNINRSDETNKLSFYFQNIETRALLQLVAQSSGLNFIISNLVKGNVTLNLKNVTWQQALKIILQTQGLASNRIGNVIYISTIDDITATETKQLQSSDALANLAPLRSVFLKLKYTNATDVANLLKGAQSTLLTPRGQVAVDTRTNSIILRDTSKNLADIVPEIKKIDIPARQVLIEARIVNIDTTYEEQLGVRFGITDKPHLSGTLAGANQIVGGTPPAQVDPFTNRLNFNNPAAQLFNGGVPGTIGLALAKVGPVLLDLELSALEGERHATIISRPRVVTSNQQKANIQTGEEIPYQEATSSGATSVTFKKAVLSLEITPQITPDNRIVLKIKATQDTRGENIAVGQTSTAGQTTNQAPVTIPAINTQAVEASVLLQDNETVVIGGVFREVKQNEWNRIPFFGTLPVVGPLFRYKNIHNEKHELLIFVTPKIINNERTFARAKHMIYKGAG